MLFLPGQLILELSTLFSTGQIFATFLEDDKCNLILKYTKKQKPRSSCAPEARPAGQTLSCCVFHLGEWHCHLSNFPGYCSQLFLSLSLTPNKSPSLESSHLNISWIGPHLFIPTASLPNSGSHHPSRRRLHQPLTLRLLPTPSSTKSAREILLKMQISSSILSPPPLLTTPQWHPLFAE